MDESRIPILIGSGQVTQRERDPALGLSPIDLTAAAVQKAADDSGAGSSLLRSLDTIVLLRSFSDTSWRFTCPFGTYSNPPKSLAKEWLDDCFMSIINTQELLIDDLLRTCVCVNLFSILKSKYVWLKISS